MEKTKPNQESNLIKFHCLKPRSGFATFSHCLQGGFPDFLASSIELNILKPLINFFSPHIQSFLMRNAFNVFC